MALLNGYKSIYIGRGKPGTTKGGYAYEHRVKMERHLGRRLRPNEIVHHKNGKKLDNRIRNLEVLTKGAHTIHHMTEYDGFRRTSRILIPTVLKLVRKGMAARDISKKVGLCTPLVRKIVKRLKRFDCPFCDRSFQKFKGLGVHIRRSHK